MIMCHEWKCNEVKYQFILGKKNIYNNLIKNIYICGINICF